MRYDPTLLEMINLSRDRHGEKKLTWEEFILMQPENQKNGRKRIHDAGARKAKSLYIQHEADKEEPKPFVRPKAVYDNRNQRQEYGLE